MIMTKFVLRLMILMFFLLSPEFLHHSRRFVYALPLADSPPSPYGLDSKIDPEMAIIIIVLLCSFFLMGFFSIYLRHCSESLSVTEGVVVHKDLSRCGLDPTVIDAFPVFPYVAVKDLKIGKIDLECAVCLSEFDDYESLRLLPKCNHVFHAECIDVWLDSHVTCPVCRANLTPESENSPEKAESSNELHELNSESRLVEEQTQISISIDRLPETRNTLLKFPRSHSTGHSLSQPGEGTERFTLRLPEEVRRQIMEASGNKLKRSSSYDVVVSVQRSGSVNKGKSCVDRQQGGRSNRWVFSMTSPFVSRNGSSGPKDEPAVHSPV